MEAQRSQVRNTRGSFRPLPAWAPDSCPACETRSPPCPWPPNPQHPGCPPGRGTGTVGSWSWAPLWGQASGVCMQAFHGRRPHLSSLPPLLEGEEGASTPVRITIGSTAGPSHEPALVPGPAAAADSTAGQDRSGPARPCSWGQSLTPDRRGLAGPSGAKATGPELSAGLFFTKRCRDCAVCFLIVVLCSLSPGELGEWISVLPPTTAVLSR